MALAGIGALVAVGAAWWGLAPPEASTEGPAAVVAADTPAEPAPPRAAIPLREYPTVLPEDAWPERPPHALVKGFGPPPPAPWVTSVGPVRRFKMPRFEVDAAVEQLAVTPTNELPTPIDASYRVGWYSDFGQPGQGGNAILSAHETWNHLQAPFFHLAKAEVGDEVIIEMNDGRTLTYVVTSNVRYEVTTIPMDLIIWPPTRGADEWLTLITCGGRIVYDERTGFGDYLDRDVVVARRVR